jgi:hypothetical protein
MAARSSRGSLGPAAGPTPDPGGLRRYEAPVLHIGGRGRLPLHGLSARVSALDYQPGDRREHPLLGRGDGVPTPWTPAWRWRPALTVRGGQLGQSRARPEHGSGQSIIDGAARLDAMIPARPSPIEPGWLRGPIEMWRRLTPFGSGAGPEPPQGRRLTEGAFHGPRDPLARASPRR